jgi:hypothetical protein
MEQIHARSIERHFSSFLTGEQPAMFAERFSAIADHARRALEGAQDRQR